MTSVPGLTTSAHRHVAITPHFDLSPRDRLSLLLNVNLPFPGASTTPGSKVQDTDWLIAEARSHEPALRGYLQRNFPSIETDDVVQESYLKLLKAKAAGTIASSKAYFFSIARNTALTIFQRNRLYSQTPLNELPDSYVLDQGRDAADATNAHQQHELVVQAMTRLPLRCREILSLAVLHGLSNTEIASRMGIAEATVRVQMARGISKCVEYMRKKGERS